MPLLNDSEGMMKNGEIETLYYQRCGDDIIVISTDDEIGWLCQHDINVLEKDGNSLKTCFLPQNVL